jgi:dTDP-glucose 4,6-dehydratase
MSTIHKRKLANILVTGGAGFIGSNFIRYLLTKTDFSGRVVNFDALTYAGNIESLSDIESAFGSDGAAAKGRYVFVRGDIRDADVVKDAFSKYDIDTVVHFAAESHVDRSILGPKEFIETNILGTFTLLEAARAFWTGTGQSRDDVLFHHVSTDEVFGSLGDSGFFTETTPYDPRSPYSASKAGSDHLVRAYHHTYGIPVTLSNCSNNYGPYQFPEKLIPVMILNMLEGKRLPVYGDGKNIRDWLYVEDHNAAVWLVMNRGRAGESYNIGGENEWENIRLVKSLCGILAKAKGVPAEEYESLISFVADRPGHDRRYAIDCSKIKRDLGFKQSVDFASGLERTVRWYLENKTWVNRVRSGAYREWIEKNYGKR